MDSGFAGFLSFSSNPTKPLKPTMRPSSSGKRLAYQRPRVMKPANVHGYCASCAPGGEYDSGGALYLLFAPTAGTCRQSTFRQSMVSSFFQSKIQVELLPVRNG